MADGNGVGYSDPANLDTTFLRGIQQTDADGAVQFDTLFPGHYTGRAPHTHVYVLWEQLSTVFVNGLSFKTYRSQEYKAENS